MPRTWVAWTLSALLIVAVGSAALAQRGGFRRGSISTWGHVNPPYDGRFTFTRIRFGPSNSWNHDYPQADRYLSLILSEVTLLEPNLEATNILDLEDPQIFMNPVLYIWEPGFWRITADGAANLRDYMLKGGFVIFDDFEAGQWYNFEAQMRRALPDLEFFPLAIDHPIYHSFFDMYAITLPHPSVNVEPAYYAVYENNDPGGRMMALVNHNADIAEYWEYSDRGYFPMDLTNDAYKLGVNYIIYALTH